MKAQKRIILKCVLIHLGEICFCLFSEDNFEETHLLAPTHSTHSESSNIKKKKMQKFLCGITRIKANSKHPTGIRYFAASLQARGVQVSHPTFSPFYVFFHLSSRGIRFRFLFWVAGEIDTYTIFSFFFYFFISPCLKRINGSKIHGNTWEESSRSNSYLRFLFAGVFCSFNCLYSSNIEKQ